MFPSSSRELCFLSSLVVCLPFTCGTSRSVRSRGRSSGSRDLCPPSGSRLLERYLSSLLGARSVSLPSRPRGILLSTLLLLSPLTSFRLSNTESGRSRRRRLASLSRLSPSRSRLRLLLGLLCLVPFLLRSLLSFSRSSASLRLVLSSKLSLVALLLPADERCAVRGSVEGARLPQPRSTPLVDAVGPRPCACPDAKFLDPPPRLENDGGSGRACRPLAEAGPLFIRLGGAEGRTAAVRSRALDSEGAAEPSLLNVALARNAACPSTVEDVEGFQLAQSSSAMSVIEYKSCLEPMSSKSLNSKQRCKQAIGLRPKHLGAKCLSKSVRDFSITVLPQPQDAKRGSYGITRKIASSLRCSRLLQNCPRLVSILSDFKIGFDESSITPLMYTRS